MSSNMMTSVGIGSIEGNVDLNIEHIALISDFKGNDVVVFGNIRRAKSTNIDIYSVTLQSKFSATNGIMFGSLDCSPSNIKLEYATIRAECDGRQVSLFRGTDLSSELSISECSIDGKIESREKPPLDLDSMAFKHNKVGVMVDINGEACYRNSY